MMKRNLTLFFLFLTASFFYACHSQKKASNSSSKEKNKNPEAAFIAAKIGEMLNTLAIDLSGATANRAEILRTADGVNISFQPDFYFESSSEKLTGNAIAVLDDISSVLVRYPYTEIFIEGHADSSGNQLNNKKLSELRAKNVALYFKSHGILTDRLAIAGYGATRPLVSNATPEGRKQNRRVIVKISTNEEKFKQNLYYNRNSKQNNK